MSVDGSSQATTAQSSADQAHDVVILGAGSGGYACALRAAQFGLTVALIEEAQVGGTCLHQGCIPTKALLHAAEVADQARDAATFGVRASLEGIDMAGVQAYKDGVVTRLFRGLTGLIESRSITVVPGRGVLSGPRSVTVTDADGGVREVRGRAIVLATGSYAKTIPGIEPDGRHILTSDHALVLDRVPASAIVLGGGVIGCEFASVWRSFGAEVTVVEALPRLVPTEEEASSKVLQRAFRKRRIGIKTGVVVTGVEVTGPEAGSEAGTEAGAGGVRVSLEGAEPLTAKVLLIAVGRGPRTAGIGLEEHGVQLDRGFVVTDDEGRTSVPTVYAVGDIVPGLQLAHRGFAQGIALAERLAGATVAPVRDELIPRVTYCSPEVASVGLTRAQAEARYGAAEVSVLTYDLGGNGKSQILKTQGQVTLIRHNDGPVVGIHLVGDRVGEMIGEAQLIVGWEAHPDDVAALVHAHPTQNEALGEAHLALAGKPLHMHS
ncbi:MAG: dihydrolipoyl dehydrogenase [Nocardioides sp.]